MIYYVFRPSLLINSVIEIITDQCLGAYKFLVVAFKISFNVV